MATQCRPSAVLGRRLCAALAAVSAGLHALMIGQTGNPVVACMLVVMLAACLWCVHDLWVGGSVRAWLLVGIMNLGMVAVHWAVPGCHPGIPLTSAGAPPSVLMATATAVAVLEAAIAAAVLSAVTRTRATRMALR